MSSDDTTSAAPAENDPPQPTAASETPAAIPDALPASTDGSIKLLKILSWLVISAGVILILAGVATWFEVRDQLADEKITVSSDADHFAGDDVNGPLTAYSEAETINKHALETSGGKTYAELDQDDPVRETVMTASFLRASLFTSVVSFGVAAFAAGVGVLMMIIGFVLLKLSGLLAAVQPKPDPVV
jgi:hypothetical protein